ncbi:hypothetical protein KP509_18G055100 [Ceratopteris richardii]|nr:hypothetical protein KP509_18G055100 [Ceratopteris richardii]
MDKNCTGVLLSCLDCFLCGYPLYRFEYAENIAVFMMRVRPGTCTLAVSDAPEVVLHRAKYLLENGFGGYHIFRKNCEDFAVYCKTGLLIDDNIIPSGGQAGSFVSGPTSALTAGVVRMLMAEPWGIVAVTAGMYCISRYALDLGNRKDVNKVAVEELVAKVGLVSPLSTEIPSMIDESNAKEEAVAGKFDITN